MRAKTAGNIQIYTCTLQAIVYTCSYCIDMHRTGDTWENPHPYIILLCIAMIIITFSKIICIIIRSYYRVYKCCFIICSYIITFFVSQLCSVSIIVSSVLLENPFVMSLWEHYSTKSSVPYWTIFTEQCPTGDSISSDQSPGGYIFTFEFCLWKLFTQCTLS